MEKFWKDILASCVMGLVVPWMVLSLTAAIHREGTGEREPTVTQIRQETQPKTEVAVLVGTDDGVTEMNLEDYLTGVVLAEMPASFEAEALKAQAVVARTYTLRARGGKSKHEQYAVCTDSTCCQGYRSREEYLEAGGREADADKIRAAVRATAGLVLTYEGELIEATYFSCSGGRTEDAVAVWGTEVAYLQSVESPGEEEAKHYRDTLTFSSGEFAQLLSLHPEGDPEEWFGEVSYSEGGGVTEITICGAVFRGTQLRKLLGLPSAAFSIEVDKDCISITTRGYGHRVGMSQYGADAMAAAGYSFREILSHYYTGTVLEPMAD